MSFKRYTSCRNEALIVGVEPKIIWHLNDTRHAEMKNIGKPEQLETKPHSL